NIKKNEPHSLPNFTIENWITDKHNETGISIWFGDSPSCSCPHRSNPNYLQEYRLQNGQERDLLVCKICIGLVGISCLMNLFKEHNLIPEVIMNIWNGLNPLDFEILSILLIEDMVALKIISYDDDIEILTEKCKEADEYRANHPRVKPKKRHSSATYANSFIQWSTFMNKEIDTAFSTSVVSTEELKIDINAFDLKNIDIQLIN
ncbi:19817_t:CDS:2, partial [Gigaspora margarita]